MRHFLALALAAQLFPILHAQSKQSPQIRQAEASLPGVRLGYIDTGGTGTPVILLHAATGSSRVWENQIPAFTAAGFRVIAFDRRGYGRTVVDPAGPQPGTAADDLEALVKSLNIEENPGIEKSGAVVSVPPESGAPVSLVRPMKPSWSASVWRSQVSIVMLIRRATR